MRERWYVEMTKLPLAYVHWDKQWGTEEGRADWTAPEVEVLQLVPYLREYGAKKVLDLGCGIGRHALLFAAMGFSTFALEMSAEGIKVARLSAEAVGVDIRFSLSDMRDLPFSDCAMDYVLAWNVIYHGDLFLLRRALLEIRRVLRTGGIFQGTLLSKRNSGFGEGLEVAKDTWVVEGNEEKSHPHCYLDARETLRALAEARLRVLSLRHALHAKPGSYHWHVVARGE